MFLSIIIPVYNAEKYLAECLDSCLNQDIPHDDYEIICVNDGSKDGSAAILDDYASRYSNIRVIHKENAGVSEARNDGFALAQGTYIWFVDNDDFIHPNALSTLKQQVTVNPCEKIVFPYYEFTETLTNEEITKLRNGSLTPCTILCDSVVWAYLIRKDFLDEHHILHQTCHLDGSPLYGYGVDNLFVYECSKYLTNVVTLSTFPMYLYRQSQTSVTKDISPQSQLGRIREYAYLAAYMRNEYDSLSEDSPSKVSAADLFMVFLRRTTSLIAQMPSTSFHNSLRMLTELNLFPMHQPAECTFSCKQFANEQNGMNKLQNILRYYSIYPAGLFLFALPYRFQRLKIRISRRLRKNALMNALLNLKNKLLGR